MSDDHDSYIICPCGMRFTGTPKEAHRMFKAHRCPLHEPEPDTWPSAAVMIIALLISLSFICTNGWGLCK